MIEAEVMGNFLLKIAKRFANRMRQREEKKKIWGKGKYRIIIKNNYNIAIHVHVLMRLVTRKNCRLLMIKLYEYK